MFHENYTQWNCTRPYLNIVRKIISSFFLKLFGEKRFVNSVKVFPASIKSIKLIQKYPHIVESYAYILKIFVVIAKERSINVFISLGICSTRKEPK